MMHLFATKYARARAGGGKFEPPPGAWQFPAHARAARTVMVPARGRKDGGAQNADARIFRRS